MWTDLPPLTPLTLPAWARALEQAWQANAPIPPGVWDALGAGVAQLEQAVRPLLPHLVVRPEIPADLLETLSGLVTGAHRTAGDRLQLAAALRVRHVRGGAWPPSWPQWLTWHIPASVETLRWASTPALTARDDVPPLLLPSLSRLVQEGTGPWPRKRLLRQLWTVWPAHHRELLSRLGPSDAERRDPVALLQWRAAFWSDAALGIDWEAELRAQIKQRLLSPSQAERERGLALMQALEAQAAAGPPVEIALPLVEPEPVLAADTEPWLAEASEAMAPSSWPSPTRSGRARGVLGGR